MNVFSNYTHDNSYAYDIRLLDFSLLQYNNIIVDNPPNNYKIIYICI
jgi:hypothetical protein